MEPISSAEDFSSNSGLPPSKKDCIVKRNNDRNGVHCFTTFFSFYLPYPTTLLPITPQTLLTPNRNTHLTPKFLDKSYSVQFS